MGIICTNLAILGASHIMDILGIYQSQWGYKTGEVVILTWIHEYYIDGFFIGRDFSWDDMWMNFNDFNVTSLEWFFIRETISKRVCFSYFQASALFNFSRKYAPLYPHNSNYIQPEISTWHMFCLGMTYASWGCCESTTWGPSWFLGLGTRARKRMQRRTDCRGMFLRCFVINFFRHKVVPHIPRSSGT